MKITFLLMLVLVFFTGSCFYIKQDNKTGLPVVLSNSNLLIYSKCKTYDSAFNIYSSGSGSIPLWCNLKEHHKFLIKNKNAGSNINVICYSGRKPRKEELKLHTVQEPDILKEGNISPFENIYVSFLYFKSIEPKQLFVLYLDIYNRFCNKQDVSCCLSKDDDGIKFSLVVEGIDDVDNFKPLLKKIVSYIESRDRKTDVLVLKQLFDSFIYDDCSFNRWYYDSIGLGMTTPQELLDAEYWDKFDVVNNNVIIEKLQDGIFSLKQNR